MNATARTWPPWASLLLVGPTGSGKTPLGEEMERHGFRGRRCLHFDFGANLRAAAAEGSADYCLTASELSAVRTSLATGALFEAGDRPMIVKILGRFMARRRSTPDMLLVLNGLPRHRGQAEGLSSVVAVKQVVALEAGADVILKRIRWDAGRDRAGRGDDDLEAVARRLAIFRERTAPLLEYYRGRGVPVTAVPVTATMSATEMREEAERRAGDREAEEFG